MPCRISFRALAYEPSIDTVIITMITDTPSHCWLRLSNNPSRIHKKSVKRRGTDFMSELRFCFTVYEDIEQLEERAVFEETEDTYDTASLTTSAYTVIYNRIEFLEAGILTKVKVKTKTAGDYTLLVKSDDGVTTYQTLTIEDAGADSWLTFILDPSIIVDIGDKYRMEVARPNGTAYAASGLYNGTLWKNIKGAFGGVEYDYTNAMGFIFTVDTPPGDTLTHTFIVPDWQYCQTKFFYFWGKVSGVTCVSTSPPFHYHNAYKAPLYVETSDKYDLSWSLNHPAQCYNADGQLFTPDHDYTVTRISLITTQSSLLHWGPYVVKLLLVDGYCWEEEVLWSYVGVSRDLPAPGVYDWTHYNDVNVPLTEGVDYRIAVHTLMTWSPSGGCGSLGSRHGGVTPLYPRGYYCYGCSFRDEAGSWHFSLTADLCFKIWE
ncbi:hypothetical protein ES705_26089 [subsurface metagenome]